MESKKKNKALIIFGLVFLAFLAFVVIYTRLAPGTIYFDNGFEESYDVYIDGEKLGEVKPREFLKVENIKNGKHTIEVKKEEELFESERLDIKGMSYIYNIGGRYTYFVVTHEYSKSGSAMTASSVREIGNEKFFEMPSVDFTLGQEVPETIEVTDTVSYLTKTSLERKIKEEEN